MTEANAINAATTGIVGNTGTSFTGSPTTQYNVLVGGSTSSTLSNVAPSVTSGIPLVSQGSAANPIFGLAVVAGGGTGATSFNTNGAVISNTSGTGALAALSLTDGQVVVGSSTGAPLAATITAGTGISVTNGHNSITVASAGSVPTTFSGDSGSATPSGNTITFNANSNSGQSVLFSGSGSTLSLKVSDANSTTTIGSGAGKSGMSGTNNTGVGALSLSGLTSGSSNTSLGTSAGSTITTGQRNICIGTAAGASLAGTESSNICLGNTGINGGSNAIYIGTQGSSTGQQNKMFVAGVNGNSASSSGSDVVGIDATTGQLNSIGSYALNTWTPQLNFGGSSAGTQTGMGIYAKVGPVIFVGFSITLTTKGGATGNATISGLPFSTGSSANAWVGPLTGGFGGINGLGAYVRGTVSATSMDCVYNAAGVYSTITNTSFASGDILQGSLTYTAQ